MNIYIFEEVSKLTTNYHSDGGLVIVAESLERAVALFNEGVEAEQKERFSRSENPPALTMEEIEKVKLYPLKYNSQKEEVFIFPDAGCC